MNGSPTEQVNAPVAQTFFAAIWPISLPGDSELQRQKKAAVRGAQLAVAVMVAAGVLGAIVFDLRSLSPLRITGLLLAAAAYTALSLHGMRTPVRVLLTGHPQPATPALNLQTIRYFVIQLALAGIIFVLSDQRRGGALAWLVLLPPVAHGVILLPRGGVIVISMVSLALLVTSVYVQQGPAFAFPAGIAFSFAIFFTWVFTLLAVSAERSRHEVQKLADELASANRKLREYAVAAEELAATRERNRVAREIHDSLGHYLTVVNVQIEAARALQPSDPTRSREALAKAQSLTQQGLNEIRRSVAALHALPLENKPLADALRQMVEENCSSGLDAQIEIVGRIRKLAPAAELTLYRATQEGLTNVRKHAGASSAKIVLDFQDATSVLLRVADNGGGSPERTAAARGFGLVGLRERAQLLGGEVRTRSAAGTGFTLEVEVPG